MHHIIITMVMFATKSPVSSSISEAGRYFRTARSALEKGDFLGAAAAYTNATKLVKSTSGYVSDMSGNESSNYRALLAEQRIVGSVLVRAGMRQVDAQLKPVAKTYFTAQKMMGGPVVSKTRQGIEAEMTRNFNNADQYLKAVGPLAMSSLGLAERTADLTSKVALDLSAWNSGDGSLDELAASAAKKRDQVKAVREMLEGKKEQ